MKSDAVKKGIAQSPQRSLLRALGLSEEELKNRWSESSALTMRSFPAI